jgi:hypothetical protein
MAPALISSLPSVSAVLGSLPARSRASFGGLPPVRIPVFLSSVRGPLLSLPCRVLPVRCLRSSFGACSASRCFCPSLQVVAGASGSVFVWLS